MVQLCAILVVLAAVSLPSIFAAPIAEHSGHFEERSLDNAIEAREDTLLGHGASIAPPGAVAPPHLKEAVIQVGSAVKQKLGLQAHQVGTRLKQKADADLQLAGSDIKHIGKEVKVKIGSGLREGLQKLRAGVRKGKGRLGKHRKFRKFRGRLGRKGKHHNDDEFDTEIVVIIKQHSNHRGGRKFRQGRKGMKIMEKPSSMMMEMPMMEPPMMEPPMMEPPTMEPPMMAEAPPMMQKAPKMMQKAPMPMKESPMPMMQKPSVPIRESPMKVQAPRESMKVNQDPSLGPFYGFEQAGATSPSGNKALPPPALASSPVALAGAAPPASKSDHPKSMAW